MSWSEIKHALNSTLGTDEFKSLDKIIHEDKYVISSDELLYSFGTIEDIRIPDFSGTTLTRLLPKIKTVTFGYFNVAFHTRIHSGNQFTSHNCSAKLFYYKNNILVHEISLANESGSNSFESNVNMRIDFEPNDIISFELKFNIDYNMYPTGTVNLLIDDFKFLGTVKLTALRPIPIETEE